MKGNEIFILKIPSVKITDFAKTMEETFRDMYKTKKTSIKILRRSQRERFNEYLISNNEISYCKDVGDMRNNFV